MNEIDAIQDISPQRPWLGLRSYSDSAKAYFYGRDAEVRELYERVRLNTLTVLYGRSGLGKTSLLQAGLLPRLKVEGHNPVLVRLCFDGGAASLLDQLRESLRRVLNEPTTDASLWQTAHHHATRPAVELARPVLVFDQFEEIFTLAQRGERQDRRNELADFMAELASFVENRPPADVGTRMQRDPAHSAGFDPAESALRIVLTLREDYLHELERWKKLLPSLMRNRMELGELDGPNALKAVVGPGSKGPTPLVDDDCARDIVCYVAKRAPGTDLAEIETVPPLLSLLCAELNEARIADKAVAITRKQVSEQSGDILQHFYDRSFENMPAAVRDVIERLLVDSTGRYRESSSRETVIGNFRSCQVDQPEERLQKLIRCRLLTTQQRDGAQRIELTHDLLVPLAAASRANADKRRAEEALREQVEAVRQKRLSLWKGRAALVMGVLFVLTGIAGFTAIRNRDEATAARKQGEQQLREAALRAFGRSQEQRDMGNYRNYYAYLAESLTYEELPEVRKSAILALQQMNASVDSPALLVDSDINDIAFSPDGMLLVTAHEDGTAHIWDARTGEVHGTVRHEDSVNSARFSPDGKRIATTSDDKTARIWDVARSTPIGGPLRHAAAVHSVMFNAAGSHVVTTAQSTSAQLWNLRETPPRAAELEHTDIVTAAEFSPDGVKVLTASLDGDVTLWNVSDGHASGKPLRHQHAVVSAHFSSDGQQVVTAAADNTVHLWNIHDADPAFRTISVGERLMSATLSADGTRLATEQVGGLVRLWDARSGTPVGKSTDGRALNPGEPPVARDSGIAISDRSELMRAGRSTQTRLSSFSPDGALIATGYDGTLQLHSARSGLAVVAFDHDLYRIKFMDFDPTGSRIAVADDKRTLRIRDIRSGEARSEPMRHEAPVDSAQLDPTSTRLLSASGRTARVWDAANAIRLAEFPPAPGPDSPAHPTATGTSQDQADLELFANMNLVGKELARDQTVTFDAQGERVAVALTTGRIAVYDVRTSLPVGEPVATASTPQHIELDSGGERLLSLGTTGTLQVWRIAPDGRITPTLDHATSSYLAHLSTDGSLVLTVGEQGGAVQLWHADTGLMTGKPLVQERPISHARFSPDDQLVVTGSMKNEIRLWNVKTGLRVGRDIRATGLYLNDVSFSADSRRIATLGADGSARVWDARTTQPLSAVLPNQQWASKALFSPDGMYLVTVGPDAARLWDIGTGQVLGLPILDGRSASAMRFSNDGRQLIIGNDDGAVRIVDVRLEIAANKDELIQALQVLGGKTIGRDGRSIPVDRDSTRRLLTRNDTKHGSRRHFDRIVQWHLADRRTRPLSPFAQTTVPEHMEREIDWVLTHRLSESDATARDILTRAYFLDPDHPLILLACSAFEKDSSIRRFWKELSLARVKDNPRLAIRAAQILLHDKDPQNAARAVDAALRVDPSYPVPEELGNLSGSIR